MYIANLSFSEQLHYLFEGYIPDLGSKHKELGYHSKLCDAVLKLLCEKDMSYAKATKSYAFISDLLTDKRFKHTLGCNLVLSDICKYDAIWLKKILIVEYFKKVTATIHFRAPSLKKLFTPANAFTELKFHLDMNYLNETHQGCFSYDLNAFIDSIVSKDPFKSTSLKNINSLNDLIGSERSIFNGRYGWSNANFVVSSKVAVNTDILPLSDFVSASYDFRLDTYKENEGCGGELKRSFDGKHLKVLFGDYGPSKMYKMINDEALAKDSRFNLKVII